MAKDQEIWDFFGGVWLRKINVGVWQVWQADASGWWSPADQEQEVWRFCGGAWLRMLSVGVWQVWKADESGWWSATGQVFIKV